MLYPQYLALTVVFVSPTYSTRNFLPRVQHEDSEPQALVELRNIISRTQSKPYPRNTPLEREWTESSLSPRDISSESPLAAVKRTLLGTRQLTCDAGYGLCRNMQRCCPDSNDNGGCCDDGQCVTKDQACCANGGACDAGLKCCGPFSCAPRGAECCSDGNYCDEGRYCVILNGIRGCCRDLSCSELDSDDSDTPVLASYSYTRTRTRTSFPLPSYTPLSIPSITIPSFTPISLPSIPPRPRPTANDGDVYGYYTYTWTYYYYYYFITTIPPSITAPTSTERTTTTTVSVYASNSAEASGQFDSLTLAANVPTAVTAPGYENVATPTSTPTRTRSSGVGSGGEPSAMAGDGGGAVSRGVRGFGLGGFGTVLLGGGLGVGVGIIAVLM